MSEMVYRTGTLVKIPNNDNMSLEALATKILKDIGTPFDAKGSTWGTALDTLRYDHSDAYYIDYLTVAIHEIKDLASQEPDDDWFKSHKTPSGDIAFNVGYYNGGCSFDEALDTAIDNMEG